jgi:hypothetical protein
MKSVRAPTDLVTARARARDLLPDEACHSFIGREGAEPEPKRAVLVQVCA